MKKRRHSLLSDLSFQSIMILMFVAVLYLSFDHANLVMNGIILCMVTVLFIVTYFTSMRTGLVLNVLFVFLLIAYTALNAAQQGLRIGGNVYFWIFWPAAMVLSISLFVKEHRQMDEENINMQNKLDKFVTIDELTQMNNLLGFERDAAIYMNISRRYGLELVLVLWKLTYQDDVERLIGKEGMGTAAGKLSDSIRKSLRKEDLIYLVQTEPYIWGTLLFSKISSAETVIQHVKEGVAETDLTDITTQKGYSLEMSGAVVSYDGNPITSLALLDKAKQQLRRKENGTYEEEMDFLIEEPIEDLTDQPIEESIREPEKLPQPLKPSVTQTVKRRREYENKKKNAAIVDDLRDFLAGGLWERRKRSTGTAEGRKRYGHSTVSRTGDRTGSSNHERRGGGKHK